MTQKYPKELTVIVYSAHGLVPIKKDKGYFSVIFGIGSAKFKTDVVYDYHGNPSFNTESNIEIGSAYDPLQFLICGKNEKDILGQILVPLSEIKFTRTNTIIKRPLEAHKKNKNPSGTLNFEVWVSSFQPSLPSIVVTESPSSLRKFKNLIPNLKRNISDRDKSRNNSFKSNFNVKSSSSCMDLTQCDSWQFPIHPSKNTDSILPEITGISPNKASIIGGTLITIRGNNLGISKEDVVGLFVCGANILSTLQYMGPNKLLCTTKAWRACTGPINIETQSGGKSISTIEFTFEDVDQGVKRAESLKNEGNIKYKKYDEKTTLSGGSIKLKFLEGTDKNGSLVSTKIKSQSSLDLSTSYDEDVTYGNKGQLTTNLDTSKPKLLAPPVVQIYPMQHHSNKKESVKPKIYKMHELEQDLFKSQEYIAQIMAEKSSLEEDNRRLKEYLERILAKVLVMCPQILEAI